MTVFFLIIQHFPTHVLEEMIFQIHFYVDFRTHVSNWSFLKANCASVSFLVSRAFFDGPFDVERQKRDRFFLLL
ncbi:hypothetical protein T4D_9428 [Trichinella pseudospiralis]|uniref:Uncharacterized protein n=1 Tax=Trichinella pseudospiralis TaxID=6337 RepID=A0A0V1FVM4_TRIPS|nr:hypothetical protein T4D_9428 [Trichinella pseudospiralis]